MVCPYCGSDDTNVIDSRMMSDNDRRRRRYQCRKCEKRFTTFETTEDGFVKLYNERLLQSYRYENVLFRIMEMVKKELYER